MRALVSLSCGGRSRAPLGPDTAAGRPERGLGSMAVLSPPAGGGPGKQQVGEGQRRGLPFSEPRSGVKAAAAGGRKSPGWSLRQQSGSSQKELFRRGGERRKTERAARERRPAKAGVAGGSGVHFRRRPRMQSRREQQTPREGLELAEPTAAAELHAAIHERPATAPGRRMRSSLSHMCRRVAVAAAAALRVSERSPLRQQVMMAALHCTGDSWTLITRVPHGGPSITP